MLYQKIISVAKNAARKVCFWRKPLADLKRLSVEVSRLSALIHQSSGRRDELQFNSEGQPVTAVMTVLIMAENVKFLREWILHHIELGADLVVLYDNSKSRFDDTYAEPVSGVEFDGVTINKHNTNYTALLGEYGAQDFIQEELARLKSEFGEKLVIVEWSQRNAEGVICYYQCDAIRDFVARFQSKVRYCLAIDADEFLISARSKNLRDLAWYMEIRGITTAILGQRRFLHRFSSLDTSVREIPWMWNRDLETPEWEAGKCLFKLSAFTGATESFYIHRIPSCGRQVKIDFEEMGFFHYQLTNFKHLRSLKVLSREDQEIMDRYFVKNDGMLRYLHVPSDVGDR